MKRYIQYLSLDTKGNVTEALGSDGVCPLDARYKVTESIRSAELRMKTFNKNLNKNFVGFEIVQGSRFGEGQVLYSTHNR